MLVEFIVIGHISIRTSVVIDKKKQQNSFFSLKIIHASTLSSCMLN